MAPRRPTRWCCRVRNTRLVYEVTEFDHEALTATLVATHSWFRSIDTISATGDDDGSGTYGATPNSEAHCPPRPSSGSFNRIGQGRRRSHPGPRRSRSRMSAKLLDRVLETPIAPSFTRIGAVVRSHRALDLDDYDLTGRTILLTGATSGLGLAAAHRLAGAGATLLVGRNPAKTDAACSLLDRATHTPVRRPRRSRRRRGARRHGDRPRRPRTPSSTTPEHSAPNAPRLPTASRAPWLPGARAVPAHRPTSANAAVKRPRPRPDHVVGWHVLRWPHRQPPPDEWPRSADPYQGAEQYARAKRVRVTLTEIWAEKFADSGVRFHSLHPGWADTPGVKRHCPPSQDRRATAALTGRGRHARPAPTTPWSWRTVCSGTTGTARDPPSPQTRRSDTPSGVPTVDWCVARPESTPRPDSGRTGPDSVRVSV